MPLLAVNSLNEKEASRGHDEGQNTKCRMKIKECI
jgi:hypothetical protein